MDFGCLDLVVEGPGKPGQMDTVQGPCGDQRVTPGPSPGRGIDFGSPTPKSCAATHTLCKICNDPIGKQDLLRIKRNGWAQMCEADRKAVRVAKQDALSAGRKDWFEQLERDNPSEYKKIVIGLREQVAVSQRGRKRSRVDFCKILEEQKRFKRGVDDGCKRLFLPYAQYCNYWQGRLPGVVPPLYLLDGVAAGKQWHQQLSDPLIKKRQAHVIVDGKQKVVDLVAVDVERYSLEETGAEVSKQLQLESSLKDPSAAAISALENELMVGFTLSFDDPIFDTSTVSRLSTSSCTSSKQRPVGKVGTKEPGKGKAIGSSSGSGKQVSNECLRLSVELKVKTLFGLLDAMVPKWEELINEGKKLAVAAEGAGNGAGPSPGCMPAPAGLVELLRRRVEIASRILDKSSSEKADSWQNLVSQDRYYKESLLRNPSADEKWWLQAKLTARW